VIESAEDRLIGRARASEEVLSAIASAQAEVTQVLLRLDAALAACQDDPRDVGERIIRALVLRGTMENVLREAYQKKTDIDRESGRDR
jgi:hypothetical protein